MKVLPVECAACSGELEVKLLRCPRCETQIDGAYELPILTKLSADDQRFMVEFVKASGSLKQMAKLMKLSYPTVRNRLDAVIERLKTTDAGLIDKGAEQ